MSGGLRGWSALSGAMFKAFLRDRTSQFFYFLFPLMFLVLFGLLLGNPGAGRIDLGVVGDGALITALPDEVVDIRRFDSFEAAVKAVEDGDIPAAVRQQGDRLELRYSMVDQVSAGVAQGILSSIVGQANQQASGAPPTFSLDSQQVENQSFEPIQFLTAGILSWGVAMSAAFGAALNLVSWRRARVLRRIRLAPISSMSVVSARIGVSLVIALLQTVLFVGVAMTPPFGLQLSAQSWMVIPLVLAGTLSFMAIGVLVGSLVKTEEGASGAVNLIVLPMAFLSGAFFDPGVLPGWLQKFTYVLPMKHMATGILDVMVRENNMGGALVHFGVIIGFTIVLGLLAARFFTWEDI